MRVLLTTALAAGGVGAHVRMLAGGLVDAGHHVVVACPSAVAGRFDLGRTGAAVVPVEVGGRLRPGQDRHAVRRLRQVAAGADVVHAHGVRAGALSTLALGTTPSGGRRPPLVVTIHNAPPTSPAAGVVYALLERVVHRRADLVLGVSPDLVDRARARGARAVDLAVVPADLTSTVAPGRRAAVRAGVRRELQLDDGQLLLLTVGRLGPQKRTHEVLEAYQTLVSGAAGGLHGRLPAVLAVAGDGPDADRLAARAAFGPGETHLLGRRDDVAELLAAADLVVSGAQWEGQPLWLQEALGAGSPIVATDVGGTGLVVGDAALLVPVRPGSTGAERVEALRHGLGQVLADETLRATLTARALRRAAELPTTADAVQAALRAYTRAGGTAYPDRPARPGRS